MKVLKIKKTDAQKGHRFNIFLTKELNACAIYR